MTQQLTVYKLNLVLGSEMYNAVKAMMIHNVGQRVNSRQL